MTSNENGNYTNAYTYGLDRISVDNLLVENEVKTDPRYYLYDGRGSVSDVINSFGQAKDKYSYDPYGEFSHGGYLGSSGTHYENFYGYNGEDYNRLSGLEYLRARYYEPETGRFLTRDSYLGSIMEPLTLNRYAYAVNNPVMNIDPSGHWPKWLSSVTKKVTSAVSSAWNSTKSFVSKAASTVGNAISNAVKEVKSWVAPINETYTRYKTKAEETISNAKTSLRNTAQTIAKVAVPIITTMNYPNEVVRKAIESVKKGCEGAAYAVSKAYQYKEQILDAVQIGLDVAGVIPGVGDLLDGVNGVISLARGNYGDAALSLAAMVPFIGGAATAAKWARRADNAVDLAKNADNALDLVKSGEKVLDVAGDLGKNADVIGKEISEVSYKASNPYDLLKQRGIPSTFDDLDREILDAGNWRMQYKGVAQAETKYVYNMIENPGPLAKIDGQPSSNFYGGKYNVEVLTEDRIYYRAGQDGKPLGQWFTSEPAESVAKVRIDTAVKEQWIDQVTGEITGTSIIDTNHRWSSNSSKMGKES